MVVLAGLSGWGAIALLAVTIALPWAARRAAGHLSLPRMTAHYWLGYGIATLVLVHAVAAMSGVRVARLDQLGLYLATAALLVTFAQVFIGLTLREQSPSRRSSLRRRHFWTMLVLVALALGHIALNSASLHALLP